jgi:acyl dehydratase
MEEAKMETLYYEDCSPGQEFETRRRTITEADIVNFAALSWDTNPLHTDREFAKETMYGERIAHGMLGLVVHSGLSQSLGILQESILAFLELSWQFLLPIKIGDTVHVVQRVKEMRETSKPDRGIVRLEKELRNQRGELVQKGTTTILLKRRK